MAIYIHWQGVALGHSHILLIKIYDEYDTLVESYDSK